MNEIQVQELIIKAILIGVGATVIMDIWALFLNTFFRIPSLNYAMVGRWIGHFPKGCLVHKNITETPLIPGERPIGWSAHYAIGIAFAGLLLSFYGPEWAYKPTLFPAILIGIVTVIAPFFLMQPCLGFGIAASKTPRPNISRLLSIVAHSIYGIGLYLSALFYSITIW
jgi:hypothetical protein